jgi:hypothetical protein
MSIAYPAHFPCPSRIEGHAQAMSAGLVRTPGGPISRQRRQHETLPTRISLAFVIHQPDYADWLTWVNAHAWDQWVELALPGIVASRAGTDTAPILVRFISDHPAELLPVHRLWYWRVRIEAEYLPTPADLVNMPIGDWIDGQNPPDWAQTWPAPVRSFDFTTAPLDPAITFTRASVGTYFDATGVLRVAAANVARFDHNPVTHAALGLLIEEGRTNLVRQSQALENAAWTKSGVTITANAIAAPDRTNSADFMMENTANAAHSVTPTPAIAVTAGLQYSVSFFAKAGARSVIYLNLPDATFGASFSHASFNLAAGACQSAGFGSVAMQDCGNGWWRCSWFGVPCILTGTASLNFSMSATYPTPPVFAATTYQGDGISGMYVWGAQFEVGAFSSSYIPALTAATARAADQASITGAAFSSWYKPGEGSLRLDWSAQNITTAYALSVTDGSAANLLHQTALAPASVRGGGIVAGVEVASIAVNVARTWGSQVTSTLAYKVDDYTLQVNGIFGARDLSGALPAGLDRLWLGSLNGASLLGGWIKALRYYGARVPLEGDIGSPPDWIVAGTPAAPSPHWISGGTALAPAALA